MTEFNDVYDALDEAHWCAKHEEQDQALWHNAETGRYVVEPLSEAAERHILEIVRHESD